MAVGFTDKDVPNMAGKTVVITGANTGLGFAAASVLAANNAEVVLACRDVAKAKAAVEAIKQQTPAADISAITLDLGDLASIKKAANKLNKLPQLDVLINNAGLMMPPLQHTADGFESQFGVNHLGPFALTGLVINKMMHVPGARVVNTSSLAAIPGKIDFVDINAEQKYDAMKRYSMSKLANLMFSAELNRRLQQAGADCISVACHPGIANTELSRYLPKVLRVAEPLVKYLFNTAEQGAWPTLQAATDPAVVGGAYYGPSKRQQSAGPSVKIKGEGKGKRNAEKLWDISAEMTGVNYL